MIKRILFSLTFIFAFSAPASAQFFVETGLAFQNAKVTIADSALAPIVVSGSGSETAPALALGIGHDWAMGENSSWGLRARTHLGGGVQGSFQAGPFGVPLVPVTFDYTPGIQLGAQAEFREGPYGFYVGAGLDVGAKVNIDYNSGATILSETLNGLYVDIGGRIEFKRFDLMIGMTLSAYDDFSAGTVGATTDAQTIYFNAKWKL